MKSNQLPMSVADIRKSFLDFFESKGHTVVPSSPLVPPSLPTPSWPSACACTA